MNLRRKIRRLVSAQLQKSLYELPSDWDDARSVNQLFCDNLRRNVIHSALRFSRGFTNIYDHLEKADQIYACSPQLFIRRYSALFGISQLDTFTCYRSPVFDDPHRRRVCLQRINIGNGSLLAPPSAPRCKCLTPFCRA